MPKVGLMARLSQPLLPSLMRIFFLIALYVGLTSWILGVLLIGNCSICSCTLVAGELRICLHHHLELVTSYLLFLNLFNFIYLFIFRERGREGEREGEKHQCVVASCMLPTGDLAHNSGMCPDCELNW